MRSGARPTLAFPGAPAGRDRSERALHQEIERLRAELERERAACALERAEADHRRSIIESSSDYVFVKDARLRYVDANSAYLAALGRDREEVVGRSDGDLFPPEAAEEISAQDRIALIAGQVLEGEASLPFGGRRRHLLVRRSRWRDAARSTLGVVTVATDITGRKEAEEQREAALANLRGLHEQARGLLDEQMRLSRRASGLLETSRRLASQPDVAGIYRLGLQTAEQHLAAAVFAATCIPGPNRLSIAAAGPRAERLAERLRGVASAASFGAELVGSRSATAALLDRRYAFDAALLDQGISAVTAMPVYCDEHPIAVIVAAWPEARECPREDLWFLENLAAQLALALQNASLRAELCRFRSSSARR